MVYKKNPVILLECHFNRWLIFYFSISWIILIIFFAGVMILIYCRGGHISLSLVLVSGFLWFGGLWLFSSFFSSIFVVEKGILYVNPFRKNNFLEWEEIFKIERPKYKIPAEHIYITSNTDGKKIILMKSMKNSSNLIGLIKKKAINLKGSSV